MKYIVFIEGIENCKAWIFFEPAQIICNHCNERIKGNCGVRNSYKGYILCA